MNKKILCPCEMGKPSLTSLLSHVSRYSLTQVFTNCTPNSNLILSDPVHSVSQETTQQYCQTHKPRYIVHLFLSSTLPVLLVQIPSLSVIILNNFILFLYCSFCALWLNLHNFNQQMHTIFI